MHFDHHALISYATARVWRAAKIEVVAPVLMNGPKPLSDVADWFRRLAASLHEPEPDHACGS